MTYETGINLSNYMGQPAILEQTAKEAIEFACACLQLARSLRNDNPVHGYTVDELINGVIEEAADNYIFMDQLFKAGILDHETVSYWIVKKNKIMRDQMTEDSKD